jgi:hypothetical protein
VLRRTERTEAAFRAAAAALSTRAPPPVFPLVRVCQLLGFLDEAGGRIGCLAHPAATGGVELRGAGAYDVQTCEAFLCPSHAWLTEREAAIAERACADHHLYGLVVTDVPFLRAVLEAVAAATGRPLEPARLDEPAGRDALRAVLALKEELAPGSEGLFGAFRQGEGGEPVPRAIDYAALGRPPSPHDQVLLSVGADPRSGNDLDLLEEEVRRRLDACAAALA